jgi:hypothetical protein
MNTCIPSARCCSSRSAASQNMCINVIQGIQTDGAQLCVGAHATDSSCGNIALSGHRRYVRTSQSQQCSWRLRQSPPNWIGKRVKCRDKTGGASRHGEGQQAKYSLLQCCNSHFCRQPHFARIADRMLWTTVYWHITCHLCVHSLQLAVQGRLD